MKRLQTAAAFLMLCIAVTFYARAQSSDLEIRNVQTTLYPFISFKSLLLNSGQPIHQTNDVFYELTENGQPVEFSMFCPESYPYNSIAMVLDNSGSMGGGGAIDSLKKAASRLVDSLSFNDECLLANFSGGGSIQVDFTGDKPLLKSAIDTLTAGGGTPLYHTIRLILQELVKRSGRRVCIVISDGGDSNPDADIEELITYANANGITIYAISWESFNQSVVPKMSLISQRTGGRYFNLRLTELNLLDVLIDAIVFDITSPACTVTYTAEGCTDSVRHIEMTATTPGGTATASEVFIVPSRPDTLTLKVVAEPDRVVPPNKFTAYLRLEPNIIQTLPLSFSFIIKFDHSKLRFRIPIVTGGTMTQNTNIEVENLRLDAWKISLSYNFPRRSDGDLIGIEFATWRSDTSRPAYIVLDSVSITNGCPNVVIAHPDTVYICDCERELAAEVQPSVPVFGNEVRLPVVLTDTLLTGTSTFSLHLNYDKQLLEPIGVDGIGAISENAALEWYVSNGDTLVVSANAPFEPTQGDVLFYVRFKVNQPLSPVTSELSIPYIRAFADCCYHQAASSPHSIIIDGLCDKIVRRRADFTLEPNTPNPARSETSFRFTVRENDLFSEAPAALILYRSDGTLINEVYSRVVRAGEHTVPYNVSSLSPGTYYYTLTISGRTQTRSLVVVR